MNEETVAYQRDGLWLSRETLQVAYEGDGQLSRWLRLRRWLGKCWDVIGFVGSSLSLSTTAATWTMIQLSQQHFVHNF
jgi:hypothetical protein